MESKNCGRGEETFTQTYDVKCTFELTKTESKSTLKNGKVI